MPDVDVAGFTVPNWRHGGTTCKLRLYSTESWTDFDGVPHLAGILGSPEDFYQEIPCTITGTVVNVPPFTTPPTVNSPTYRNVRVTGIFVDEKDSVISPPLFEDWVIPTYSPTTWFKLAVYNASPNAPLGDRYVTIDALLALLIGEGTGLLDGLIPLLDSDNVFTGDNVFEGDVTAGRLITPLVLGGTNSLSSLTLRATSGAGQPGSEIHFQVGNNGSIEALTIHSDGSMLAKDLTSDNLAARGFSLISSVTSNKVTFLANPNSTAYSMTWPLSNGIGVLTNDGSGHLTWEPAGSGGGGPTGPTTGTGAFVLQDLPTINNAILNSPTMTNADIGAAHGFSLILTNNVGMQLRLSNGGANYAEFKEDAGGALNFYSAGHHLNPQTSLTESLGDFNKRWLTVEAAELHVGTLVAQQTIATIGGRILVGPTTQLMVDLAANGNTITVKHNQMAPGDVAALEARGNFELVSISSWPTVNLTNPAWFDYFVARNQDGSGANAWIAGDAVFNTGHVGSGFIDLYAQYGLSDPSVPVIGTSVGPTIVGNVRNTPVANDWTEHWAIGNLRGVYGYTGDTYGAAFGKYAAGAYVTIDAQNGYQAYGTTGGNIPVIWLKNDGSGYLANDQIAWDKFGNLTVVGRATIAGWAISATQLSSGAGTNAVGLSTAVTGADDVRIYAGSATPASAPFRVTESGVLFASNATITGNITANSGTFTGTINSVLGTIGGWVIGTTLLSATGVELRSGASAGLAFGTAPSAISATTGTGIFLDKTGLYGLNAGVAQVKLDSASGRLVAGQGNVILDINGVTLVQGGSATSFLKWTSTNAVGSPTLGSINTNYNAGTTATQLIIGASAPATDTFGFASSGLTAGNNQGQACGLTVTCNNSAGGNYSCAMINGTTGNGHSFVGLLIQNGTSSPIAQAMLHARANATGKAALFEGGVEINTTIGALLHARLTQVQINALTPVDGQMFYNTTRATMQMRTSGQWRDIVATIGAKVSNSAANFPVPSGVTTPINFDHAWFDTDTLHTNSAMPRLTCKVAGMYLIQGALTIAGDGPGAGYRQLQLKLNGATLLDTDFDGHPSPGLPTGLAADTVWNLNVGDWVELHVFQNSGIALSVNGSNGATDYSGVYLSMVKIG